MAEKTSSVIRDISNERLRQIQAEGWTPEHDDEHTRGQLAMAAAYYAISHLARKDGRCPYAALLWPWSMDWLKRKSRRHDLVRAGALIVAEIERLDRQAAKVDRREIEILQSRFGAPDVD
jgi:hypothetical protein